MSLPSLKNVFKPIIDLVLGKPCDSGLGHRWSPLNIITNDTYCMHDDCRTLRDAHNFAVVDFGGGEVKGRKEAIQKVKENYAKMYKLASLNDELNIKITTVFEEGRQYGSNMELVRLYNTMLQSRQLLLDTLAAKGINEHRVAAFVEWYENTRDPRVNPREDDLTYKVCKNIMDLEDNLRAAQKADVQLT
jgi:uncharacterized protein YdcH (DUF465 family)